MTIQAPPGVFDILPKAVKNPWQNSLLWTYVEMVIRDISEQYGYQEIRTPIFERTELFQRGVGEGTDIVSKEMYTFIDKGKRSLTLRPEGTASVARAFIEHNLSQDPVCQKVFYIGPMFRYERSQAGRYRQHHQFGAEVIGNPTAEQDAELIDLLYSLYTRLGLKNLKVTINSIGDPDCRQKYKEALSTYLNTSYEKLSEDSKKRLKKNPLRILDSKDPGDISIVEKAPSILDFLTPECQEHFENVQASLESLNIPYQINDKLVRGLDYYNRTVYEIIAEELGAQNSIGGGGRYDGLMKLIGGPDTPSTGFATGIERIIQTMIAQDVTVPEAYAPTIYLIALGERAKTECFKILHDLRSHRIRAQMDFSGRKLGKVMSTANQLGAIFVAVIGDKEIDSEIVELKNMKTGEKIQTPLYHLSRILRLEVEGEDFIRIWKEMNTPFEQPLEAEFFLRKLEQSIENTKHLTSELQEAMKKMQDLL